MKKRITQKRLKELLYYNPESGIFTRKICSGRYKRYNVGHIAGSENQEGYIVIAIDGFQYKAHRLAWFYINGYFPELGLDHINRVKKDNRIENLREVSQQCNLRNTGNCISNTSGVKGVFYHISHRKWCARIKVNKKLCHGGYYMSFSEAVCARLSLEQSVNWSGCDSYSPAFKYVSALITRSN